MNYFISARIFAHSFLLLATGAFSTEALAQAVQKTGFDVSSSSTTVASVANPARYVVSTSLPAGSTNSITLTDAIPSGTQYIAGSLQVPLGATRSWSIDGGVNYVAVEPSPASSVTHVKTQNLSGTSNYFNTAVVPAPPVTSFSGGDTGGDGYRVIPFNNKVYTIYHHTSGAVLYCADVATGFTCPGYPFGIPTTSSTPFDASANFITAFQYPEYLNRITGELYFFAIDMTTLRPRVICANLLAQASCGSGSYLFAGAPTVSISPFYANNNPPTPYRELDGGVFGTRLYAMISDGSFACFDAALNAPCSGTAANGTFASGIPSSSSVTSSHQAIQIDTRIYQWFAILSGGHAIACFDMATNTPCPELAFPLVSVPFGPLFPSANSAGAADGFCVAWTTSNTCYSMAGVVQLKPGLAAYLAPRAPFGVAVGLGTALLYQGKTYWLRDNFSGSIVDAFCWDWAIGAACVGFSPPAAPISNFYEAVADPDRPFCIWTLGDAKQIRSIDVGTGGSCSSRIVVTLTASPAIASCNAPGASTAWTTINLTGLAAGADYTSATITIRDSLGVIVPGFNGVTVASFPFNISSIPYGGNTTSLSISVELTGIPSMVPPAYTANPPPFVTVSWTTNDNSQMCFDVTVSCSASVPLANTVSGTLNNVSVNASHQFTSVDRASCGVVQPAPVPTLSRWQLALLSISLLVLGALQQTWRRICNPCEHQIKRGG